MHGANRLNLPHFLLTLYLKLSREVYRFQWKDEVHLFKSNNLRHPAFQDILRRT